MNRTDCYRTCLLSYNYCYTLGCSTSAITQPTVDPESTLDKSAITTSYSVRPVTGKNY